MIVYNNLQILIFVYIIFDFFILCLDNFSKIKLNKYTENQITIKLTFFTQYMLHKIPDIL